MKETFDGRRDVWGPILASQLRVWSDLVFRPAAAMKTLGLYHPSEIGTRPAAAPKGGGPGLSAAYPRLNLLEEEPEGYARLRQFDLAAPEYRIAVDPYTKEIFEAATPHVHAHLARDSRVLEAGCGPGREAHLLAERVPEGEVIAADLSREMILEAWRTGKRAALDNVTYFQMDAADPPADFENHFDVVYCQLSFHFFQHGRAVAEAFRRVLHPGGVAVVVDPGPAWFNIMSAPLAGLANPAFVRYRTGEEFCELFRISGFETVYWTEMLPGMGLTVAGR